MLEAVFFDLDGTLVDSMEDIAFSVNSGLKKLGLSELPLTAYPSLVGWGLENLCSKVLISLTKSDAEKEELYRIVLSVYSENPVRFTRVYPHMEEVLEELQSQKVAVSVVSNKKDELVKEIVHRTFPKINFFATEGLQPEYGAKSDPSLTLSIVEKLKVKAENCIFVGDSAVDIKTAKNSFMKSCGVLWGYRGEEELLKEGADFIVKDSCELKALFRSLSI